MNAAGAKQQALDGLALVGLADTVQLTRPPPTDEQRELIVAMRASAMRMAALVNNLLDMARLESGAVHLDRQWQPLEDVVGSAIGASAALLEERPLKVDLAADLPLLQFDAVLIERVLCNLLENAAKFSPADGPIRIEAVLQADAVRVSVMDAGVGLPAGEQERLFEPFVRGEGVATVPGLGLGLSICRIIVEAHGGVLSAANREEGGACFAFTLPRGVPPDLESEGAAHE